MKKFEMDMHLTHFVRQWVFVAALSATPVILTAFAAIPFTLGYHPGSNNSHGPSGVSDIFPEGPLSATSSPSSICVHQFPAKSTICV
jgi:hypothetical protein